MQKTSQKMFAARNTIFKWNLARQKKSLATPDIDETHDVDETYDLD